MRLTIFIRASAMCTVRNETGVFFSAKSGRGEEARRVVGVRHPQLVQHVEDGGLEGAVAAILKARLGFLDARVFALVEVNAQEAPGSSARPGSSRGRP